MTTAIIDRPATSLAEMGLIEAKGITLAIKENFNSLGAMILQARDRKAYKALGYRAFETYCKTEFGKSVSQAYQLIEDVKAVAELEAEISKQYDEPITLKIPSSHLRPLKHLPEMGDKLKAIEYAKKLATAEGKTPTKKHVEIAVFQVSGKRSDGFKNAIEGQGFTKGTQVEVTKSLRKDRGFVTKVDRKGKIYIELYKGGAVPILCDASELRILGDTEKPAIPANDNTVNKGDKIRIFAKGLEGRIGEIYAWKMGKHAMVIVDGDPIPVSVAYAELELLTINEWDSDLSWVNDGKAYCFNSKLDTITCDKWPSGLTLRPHHSELGPAEWMEKWESHHTVGLLESLINPSAFKRLALALAIKLPEEKKNEFVSDLIAGLVRLLPSQFKLGASPNKAEIESIQAENQRSREQLAEAESVIEAIVGIAHEQIQSLPEAEETTEFLVEDAASIVSPLGAELFPQETTDRVASEERKANRTKAIGISFSKTIDELVSGQKTQTRRAWQEDYAKSFIRYFEEGIAIPALSKGRHRGGHELGHIRLTERPYQQYLSEMSSIDLQEEGGMVSTPQEFIDGFFEGQDKSVWVLHFEFEAISSSANIEAVNLGTEFPQEMTDRIASEREKLFDKIENFQTNKGKTKREKEQNAKKEIDGLRYSLSQLDKLENLRIGQTVYYKNDPIRRGEITGFAFTTGGMPHVFVRWESENDSVISTEIVSGILISPPGL